MEWWVTGGGGFHVWGLGYEPSKWCWLRITIHTNTLATVVYWISRAPITTTILTCFCFSSAVWGHIGAHSNKHNTWSNEQHFRSFNANIYQKGLSKCVKCQQASCENSRSFPLLPPAPRSRTFFAFAASASCGGTSMEWWVTGGVGFRVWGLGYEQR